MKRLEELAAKAEDSFYAQAMTFEGDAAGQWLIDVMKKSPAKDKRLLIDCYSKVVINDRFVRSTSYLFDKAFREEVHATKQLIKDARAEGIQVQFTNPVGMFGQKYPLRNHKKMVVLDRSISFLGGINFSDHNFEWHDMMVEIHDPLLGEGLVEDFQSTWKGVNQSKTVATSQGQLYLFNGSKSKELYDAFFEHITSATKSVKIISPYISEPLLGVLRSMTDNEVAIEIVSPQENNKSIFKHIIFSEAQKGYFRLKEYPGMSHMKAILIDDKKLIFGSSNYDLVSYFFEQEVVFISEDPMLIAAFNDQVMREVRQVASEEQVSAFQTKKASFVMSLLNKVGGVISRTILRPY